MRLGLGLNAVAGRAKTRLVRGTDVALWPAYNGGRALLREYIEGGVRLTQVAGGSAGIYGIISAVTRTPFRLVFSYRSVGDTTLWLVDGVDGSPTVRCYSNGSGLATAGTLAFQALTDGWTRATYQATAAFAASDLVFAVGLVGSYSVAGNLGLTADLGSVYTQ